MRARRAAGLSNRVARPSGDLDIFADPSSPQKQHRVRRNSESSIGGRSIDPEEEKRRQERRRRERRHREASKSGPKKTDRKLDIIDKLDVTSIYGTGREYPYRTQAVFLSLTNQYFTMMDLSMLATLIETEMEADVRQNTQESW